MNRCYLCKKGDLDFKEIKNGWRVRCDKCSLDMLIPVWMKEALDSLRADTEIKPGKKKLKN